MSTLKERLIDILLKSDKLTKKQIADTLEKVKDKAKGSLRDILIKEGLVSEKELVGIFSEELFIPFFDISRYKIDPEVVKFIPEHIAKQYKLICISRLGNTLTVAMTDPLNILALDDVKTLTGFEIEPVLGYEKDIDSAIENYYGSCAKIPFEAQSVEQELEVKEGLKFVEEIETAIELPDLFTESQRPPIVKIVDLIIQEAIKKRASDIHIEPTEDVLRLRYRIDGELHDVFRLPKKNQNAILARVKIMCAMDITESRLPQDGRFKIRIAGDSKVSKPREIDFRVSALPCSFGQKFVLRILDKTNLSLGLDNLGFSPVPLELFKQAVKNPYGMILVTGPTGSGKTTTLYSIVSQFNTIEHNIVAIEDPVEYQVDGITQIQVKPEIGLSFANGLRSILRQNPDIIMVGEIRDSETADIAVKASLTGQMVLSTLHTNDAIGAIVRLIDMGVEPFLVASGLIAVVAQRLCRRICLDCKESYNIDGAALDKFGVKQKKPTGYFHGRGCNSCNNTGYRGRMAVIEILLIDDTLRDMIIRRKTMDEIKEYAVKEKGMQTLREDALEKFYNGTTTLEEVIRVTAEE